MVNISSSLNLEESYKKGLFNKSNDLFVPKNQMSIFVLNINFSYSFARISTIDATTVEEISKENINVSLALKRPDLAKIWKMINISLCNRFTVQIHKELILWMKHPTGWIMVKNIVSGLIKRGDIQNIAILGLCLFKVRSF